MQRSIARTEQKLNRLSAFVAAETAKGGAVDGEKFNTLAAGLHASATWIRAIQVVADGVITHTYPLAGNEPTVGFNLLTAANKYAGKDIGRALETGRTTVTGPLELIQGGLGVVFRQAVPSSGGGPRRLVGIVLNIGPLLNDAGIPEGNATDGLLAIRTVGGGTFFGPAAVFDRQPVVHRITLPDGAWEMGVCPRSGWNAGSGRAVWLFYSVGSVVIVLASILVYVLARSRSKLTESIREKTNALREELATRHEA
ncbi:MAG TPA: CHASE domain-containing protein [Lacunisphaera sp.]|nr:CHASE domain-containing protein [Lacunisphaera sp.]